MMTRTGLGGLILALWAAAPPHLEAQTTLLVAAGDSTLKSGSPNQNQGSETALRVQSSGHNRALVQFNPAAIQATVGAGSLASARLELFIAFNSDNWGTEGRTVDAHRLTQAWTEAGVTWNCPIDTLPANGSPNCTTEWDGGAFEEEPSDTVLHTSGMAGWVGFDVTADVQALLAGASHFGWLVKKTEEGQSGRVDYASREAVVANRPRLVLEVESATHDEVPPRLTITAPNQPVLVNQPSPAIALEYSDGGTGPDSSSLEVRVDGTLAICAAGTASATCQSPSIVAGPHAIEARLRDQAGNLATASFGFELLTGPGLITLRLPLVADTYLRMGPPNQNQGNEPRLRVRQGGRNRALAKVDPAYVASLLAGATVRSARLELFVEDNGNNWGSTGRTVDLHRVTAPWSELGATWNCAEDTEPANHQPDCAVQWGGGTYDPTVLGSLLVTNGLAGPVGFDVTAELIAIAAGADHEGWLLKKALEGRSGRVEFSSREGVVEQRPAVVVVFETEVGIDSTPPTLWIYPPSRKDTVVFPTQRISVSYWDTGSGVDLSTLTVSINGADIAATCTQSLEEAECESPPLSTGMHHITASLRDGAGNLATASVALDLVVDLVPPVVTLLAPPERLFVRTSPFLATGSVTDDGELERVTLNEVPITLTDGTFSVEVDLTEGFNSVVVSARDTTGKEELAWEMVFLDTQPPTLVIEAPTPGAVTNRDLVRVSGSAADSGGIERFEVNGSPVAAENERFSHTIPLVEGTTFIQVRAVDQAGNATTAETSVRRLTPPEVAISEPRNLAWIDATSVDVTGAVDESVTGVTVNGVAGLLSSGSFLVRGVPLLEGGNVLSAVAVNAQGHMATATVQVVRDLTPPRLAIYGPSPGAVLHEPSVAVFGLVNDIVPGTVNAGEVTVLVNNQPAEVVNRSFLLPALSLTDGLNSLVFSATDAAGNRREAVVTVRREPTTTKRLTIVSGDRQAAEIGVALPLPLVVRALDSAGLPVPNVPVLFKVIANDGSLIEGRRQLVAATNANGDASTSFTLGTRVGLASQRVEAVGVGYGKVVFLEDALSGEPDLIVVDSGDQQVGVAGRSLPRPLVAAVTDTGRNRLPGVPVRFAVVKGEGRFPNGLAEIVVETDSDGRAIVPFELDPQEGTASNVVEATVEALPAGPFAAFTASGWAAGEPGLTALTGVVLDNSNLPVPEVTLRIKGTVITAQTDARGSFRIQPAPVGTFYLVADGSTTSREGSWPDLEFVVTTVAGRDNDLGMPIYLLPLNQDDGVFVDETRGATLKLPAVPGFSLEIEPGSVTFPGGSRSGVVSVTAVHSDKVPMVPNFGQQPRLIVTIQPAGARFEPPARLTLPNVDGLPVGAVTEFYSFDHDLGHFVSIGPATVSEDGATVASNPGVGIVKAGWHCGGTPAFTGSAHNCGTCQSCVNNRCQADDAQPCSVADPCKTNAQCFLGTCVAEDLTLTSIEKPCFGEVGQPVTFTAVSNDPSKVEWKAPTGQPATGSGASFTTVFSTAGQGQVQATACRESQGRNVEILPGCGTSPQILYELQPSSPPCDTSRGQTEPKQHRIQAALCAQSGQRCPLLKDIIVEYEAAAANCPEIDIPAAESPEVRPDTCEEIVADLTPEPVGSTRGPPRRRYWVRRFTEQHEQFHVDHHLKPRVQDFFLPALERLYREQRWCDDGCGPVPRVPQEETQAVWEREVTVWWNDPQEDADREVAAHNEDRNDYLRHIAEIRARADREGWPTCRTTPSGGGP